MNNSTRKLGILPFCLEPVQIECYVAMWLWKTLPVLLLVLGTCGNILNLVVMSRKKLRAHSTTIYMLFLAISDVTFMYSSVSRYFLLRIMSSDMNNWSIFNCIFHEWFTYTAAAFSVWLLVCLTVERTVLTVWPIKSRRIATRKTALITCIVLLTLSASFAGHLLFSFELRVMSEPRTDLNGTSVVAKTSAVCLPKTTSVQDFLKVQWKTLIMVVLNIVPMLIIFTGNVIIAVQLSLQKKRRRLRVHPVTDTLSGLDEKRKAAAKMVLFICAFFFLTSTPYTCFAVVKHAYFNNITDPKAYARLQLIHAVVHILLYCNYTFNFWLYFASGSLFKAEWKEMTSQLREKLASLTCWFTNSDVTS